LSPITDKSALLAECDKCVMCGLCLPHCPTYTLTLDENESPRGRISLVRALLRGDIASNDKLDAHLQHCLVCRACEHMCPSKVKYGQIIDGIRQQQPAPLPMVVTDKQQLQSLNRKICWYQNSGLQKIVRKFHLLGNGELAYKEKLLPAASRQRPWAPRYPALSAKKGEVQLFTGCISNSLDHKSLRAAVNVLSRLGYDVIVPAGQNCCGGMHLHKGHSEQAKLLAQANQAAFVDNIPVISLHSGCNASLVETLQAPLMDVCDFLVKENITPDYAPLEKRVVVHSPCTKRNVLRSGNNVVQALSAIPQIELVELPTSLSCCGAAGSYMLDFADMAAAIREPVLEAIKHTRADILVTSNIGCAMHLQAGLREQGIHIELFHPVEIIAKQLPVK
jgi:glycolate oxidase iron-sulfur subunit